ncbi:hypothetical protein GQX73_g2851 [Xylaria multiplex]|uniref:Zinc transporter n=1 Tax=Xylaria multiplex TaxID=323545 RepID=A0A7C8N1I0_9PEZI|nr:hypothetical protein GQX73_g2851 [Xylaria multiplex]
MASSYALPQAPPLHSHGHSHSPHGSIEHIHSHSHSPPSFGHSRSRSSLSNASAMRSHSHNHSHGHGHSPSSSHESIDEDIHLHTRQNLSQYRANSFIPLQRRENRPSPLRQNTEDLPSPGEIKIEAAAPHKHTHSHNDGHHHHHDHDHDHDRGHDHHHSHSNDFSRFTGLLLPYTSKWPLIHAIMTDKDSRRIFYFMGVNFSFMTVQAVYGYLTDSLGLLSDSIHMFFDCVALAVGLFASVMSKWPPSARFPYGFGKVETLSGFANGVFLILISLEIMFEAFERLLEGRETKRLGELFVVSTMGLVVNLLGIFAFGSHGHHHGHGHDHSHHHHGHSHAHSHGHSHDEKSDHDCSTSEKHGHGHSHDNENMHGIYLHILADTLGSASVIASTALTYLMPWSGWDPLASFLIAYLILITATPLVKSSAQRLLLTNTADTEYNLRNTLSEITNQRGVASYSVPKFWTDDRTGSDPGGKLQGVMHVAAMRGVDPEEVRDRVQNYLARQGIDVTIQMEREGDGTCWCGMGRMSPLSPRLPGGF